MAKVRMIWKSWFRRPRNCGGAISLQQHKYHQGKLFSCRDDWHASSDPSMSLLPHLLRAQ